MKTHGVVTFLVLSVRFVSNNRNSPPRRRAARTDICGSYFRRSPFNSTSYVPENVYPFHQTGELVEVQDGGFPRRLSFDSLGCRHDTADVDIVVRAVEEMLEDGAFGNAAR